MATLRQHISHYLMAQQDSLFVQQILFDFKIEIPDLDHQIETLTIYKQGRQFSVNADYIYQLESGHNILLDCLLNFSGLADQLIEFNYQTVVGEKAELFAEPKFQEFLTKLKWLTLHTLRGVELTYATSLQVLSLQLPLSEIKLLPQVLTQPITHLKLMIDTEAEAIAYLAIIDQLAYDSINLEGEILKHPALYLKILNSVTFQTKPLCLTKAAR